MKFVRYLIVLVVAVALGLLGSLVKPADEAAFAQGQVGCTVTVRPGESIQAAIDRAPEGAVICLTEGRWEENIVIEKSLTLRGAGQEKTVIDGVKKGYPVIWIRTPGEQQVLVQLEGLTITRAWGACAQEWPICPTGVVLQGLAQVTISDSTISENEYDGIELLDSAKATISNSTISENQYDGILLWDSAKATISNSTISGNWTGIKVGESAQATISYSTIHENTDGIKVRGRSQTTIIGSKIINNTGWGVVAFLKKCGWVYDWNEFTGKVEFLGTNVIEGNGAGQVCLP